MTTILRFGAAAVFALATAGCDLQERMEGKSPSREHIENIARLAEAMPPAPEPVAQPAPVPLVALAAEAEPEIIPAPPVTPPAPPMPVCVFDDRGFMICT